MGHFQIIFLKCIRIHAEQTNSKDGEKLVMSEKKNDREKENVEKVFQLYQMN